jgi:hypothetical protein
MLIDMLDLASDGASQNDDVKIDEKDAEQPKGSECHDHNQPLSLSNIYLGTPQNPISLDVLQQKGVGDVAFKDFRNKLHRFLSAEPDAGSDIAEKIQLSTKVWHALFYTWQLTVTL